MTTRLCESINQILIRTNGKFINCPPPGNINTYGRHLHDLTPHRGKESEPFICSFQLEMKTAQLESSNAISSKFFTPQVCQSLIIKALKRAHVTTKSVVSMRRRTYVQNVPFIII